MSLLTAKLARMYRTMRIAIGDTANPSDVELEKYDKRPEEVTPKFFSAGEGTTFSGIAAMPFQRLPSNSSTTDLVKSGETWHHTSGCAAALSAHGGHGHAECCLGAQRSTGTCCAQNAAGRVPCEPTLVFLVPSGQPLLADLLGLVGLLRTRMSFLADEIAELEGDLELVDRLLVRLRRSFRAYS